MECKINLKTKKSVDGNTPEGGMYEFFQKVDDIRKCIYIIQKDAEYFGYMYSALLSTQPSDEDMKESVMDLMSSIKKSIESICMKLKRIGENNNRQKATKEGANLRIRHIQHLTLSRLLIDVIGEYGRTQEDYLERCKFKVVEQFEMAGRRMSSHELEDILEQGKLPVFTRDMIMDTVKSLQILANIEERHIDILKLKSSIQETSDILAESLMLVERYSDVEDTVAYQIEKTDECCEMFHEKSDSIVKLNESISGYKPKNRRKNISIFCCISAVTFIIVGAVAINFILFKMVVSKTPSI